MTAAQRKALDWALDECEPDSMLADALRAALGTCGTCAHAGEQSYSLIFCAASGDITQFPFKHRGMPLDERCKGWTAKEGA